MSKSIVAQRLKAAREKKKLTQVDVYNRTGINNKTLSGYENDVSAPDLETLKMLADLYEVTTDYLLGVDENKKEAEKLIPALVLSESETMIMNDAERGAYEKIKSLSKEKQNQLIIEKFNSLPAENQKAIMAIINLFLSSRQ